MPEQAAPLVSLKNVNKHFGDLHVLRDINLDVARGEVVVVIGPSGSGKSTLCRAINRLETIDDGEITIDGKALPAEGKALAKLRADAHAWATAAPEQPIALVGDWNVAPTDDDVWDPSFFEGKTHTSQPERDAFHAFAEAGFTDVVRPHAPGPGVYTYWDYTQLRFPKKQGMRIDFVLGSPAFAARVRHAEIDRDERKGKGASDHAPVIVDLEV